MQDVSTRPIRFPGASGDALDARIELPPDGRPKAWALFAHCFTCSKNLKAAVRLTRALAAKGFGVMRFDFTGLGESEGDFADTDFSSNVDDLLAAAAYLEEEHEAPSLLVGHSLGGAAVLQAAPRLDSVRAVATIGAPADPAHLQHLLSESIEEIRESGEATVTLAGRSFRIRREFLEDLEQASMRETVRDLRRALLILHSPVDETVGIDNAAQIYTMAKHPKSFVSLDDADHLLTDEGDARYAGEVLAAWASRYIDWEPDEEDRLSDGDGVVARLGAEGFRTELGIRGHSLTADEPEDVGGTDEGPSPYEFVSAGLGACTAMTLRMYADRKEWPLEGVQVHLTHSKIHRKDCADCEDEGGDSRLDRIERVVALRGPLDEEQRQRLLEIADRCPVHRTLDAGMRIATTLEEE